VHTSVASELDGDWVLEPLPQLLCLRGEPLDALALRSGPQGEVAAPGSDAPGADAL